MTVLYHYTDKRGYYGINETRTIRKTHGFDDGVGVYFTSRCVNNRSVTKENIARDNYNRGWSSNLSKGKLDYIIEVHLPSDKVKETVPSRNVWLYPSEEDLDLANYQHALYPVSNPMPWKTYTYPGQIVRQVARPADPVDANKNESENEKENIVEKEDNDNKAQNETAVKKEDKNEAGKGNLVEKKNAVVKIKTKVGMMQRGMKTRLQTKLENTMQLRSGRTKAVGSVSDTPIDISTATNAQTANNPNTRKKRHSEIGSKLDTEQAKVHGDGSIPTLHQSKRPKMLD